MENKKNESVFKKNMLLMLFIVVIGIFPLLVVKNSEFGGADGKAEELIQEINPDYKPWVSNLLEPPGGETESLLFALQAAFGSGIVFYVLGYFRGKKRGESR